MDAAFFLTLKQKLGFYISKSVILRQIRQQMIYDIVAAALLQDDTPKKLAAWEAN